MARPAILGKRENEKKKQARRIEKQNKKEKRKLSGKANSFDDMIAYVDENGVITSTPPEKNEKEKVNQEEIRISTPKKEIPAILKGRIEHLDALKGYGFIKDLSGTDKYFFHVSNVLVEVMQNDIVTFDLERGKRGMNAINISTLDKAEL